MSRVHLALSAYEAEPANSCDPKRSVDDTSDSRSGWQNIVHLNASILFQPFDGITEAYGPRFSRLRGSTPASPEQDTSIKRPALPATALSRAGGKSLADRREALNQKIQGQRRRSAQFGHAAIEPLPSPGLSPNLTKRMNPFLRRDAEGRSSGANKEDPPSHPPLLHERRSTLSYSDSKHDDLRLHDFQSGRRASQTLRFQGSGVAAGHAVCNRHGRKLKSKGRFGPTTDGLDKSLGGAYIPSGRRIRRQVDPGDPHYFLHHALTKTEGSSLSPEPCPDCIAEERIRRKEDADREAIAQKEEGSPVVPFNEADGVGDIPAEMLSLTRNRQSSGSQDISSTITEPGTPPSESRSGPSLISTTGDRQTVLLPGTSVSSMLGDEGGSLVAADLGDMIDAIIIEHRGSLNRVITNLRNGVPGLESVQRISRELSAVSQTLATMRSPKLEVLDSEKGNYSIILDTPPDFLQPRTKSIPDILEYIDSAANDLGIDLTREGKKSFSAPGLELPEENDSERRAQAMPLHRLRSILKHRAADKSVAPPRSPEERPAAPDQDEESPPSTPRETRSPLLLAVNVLEAMPRSDPVPMIGDPDTMEQDFLSTPAYRESDARSGSASSKGQSSLGRGGTTDGSSESLARPSKMPSTRNTPGDPRSYVATPISMIETPWSMPGRQGGRDPFRAMRPSEVKGMRERDKKEVKMELPDQPSMRDLARDASQKERAQRRARVSRQSSMGP